VISEKLTIYSVSTQIFRKFISENERLKKRFYQQIEIKQFQVKAKLIQLKKVSRLLAKRDRKHADPQGASKNTQMSLLIAKMKKQVTDNDSMKQTK
jgi:hypothetical protein